MLRAMVLVSVCLGCWAMTQAADQSDHSKQVEGDVITMVSTGGWGAGVLETFHVRPDGRFEWTQRQRKDGPVKRLSGTLTAEQVAALRQRIAVAPEGPAAEDAGYVEFTWRVDAGLEQKRAYSSPGQKPCSELMKAVRDLATKHGKPPTTQPVARNDRAGEVPEAHPRF